jgi:hypothetical protein
LPELAVFILTVSLTLLTKHLKHPFPPAFPCIFSDGFNQFARSIFLHVPDNVCHGPVMRSYDHMDMTGHNAPGIYIKALMFHAIFPAIQKNIPVFDADENINPRHDCKTYKIAFIRIIEFVFPAHTPCNDNQDAEKVNVKITLFLGTSRPRLLNAFHGRFKCGGEDSRQSVSVSPFFPLRFLNYKSRSERCGLQYHLPVAVSLLNPGTSRSD